MLAGYAERELFRPSRTSYPGSRFGPKSRYDLPQRHKAYGNGDEAEAALYRGTNLQPLTWVPSGLGAPLDHGVAHLPATPGRGSATPRQTGVLTDVARSLLHPLADRNLPELPLIDERNDVHGILVLGGRGCGKTSLVMSMTAMLSGSFPSRYDTEMQEKRQSMPAYGNSYELPEREVRLVGGGTRQMRLVLTDTPPCGTSQREEQPLCATVSPNSAQHFNAIPSWMRITLRSGNFPHYAVLFVIDGLARPLWEDGSRCRELARLLSVLKRNQYTVVLAVTKLKQAREAALRDAAHGRVGKDPRSSYESFASRYIEKCCAAIQAKAVENDWSFSHGPDVPAFPLLNVSIFDVPTWTTVGEFNRDAERRGTSEVPNYRYAMSQLNRLLLAASARSHPE